MRNTIGIVIVAILMSSMSAAMSITGTVGSTSFDPNASSGAYYLRYVGDPAPAGYAHSYQWGSPEINCDPNQNAVTFSGEIEVDTMNNGDVAFIGLLDTGLLASGKSGFMSGAYVYVYKTNSTNVRIGPSDGNLNGEIVQVYKDYTIPQDGTLDIELTIYDFKITLSIEGDSAMEDDYGLVKVLNNLASNGLYAWNEFEYGANPGWTSYPAGTSMGYDLEIEGCGPSDTDGDGILDDVDNCPDVANPGQEDLDENGIGNVCDARYGVIVAPSADEEILGDLNLLAYLVDDDQDPVSWAVRKDSCAQATNTVIGNVDGKSTPFTWTYDSAADLHTFSASVNTCSWEPGLYYHCFVFNPTEDAGESDIRLTRQFHILDCDADDDGYLYTDDCDDSDATVYPGAPELCDAKDNDCDATTDDGTGESWYEEATTCGVGACSSTGMLTCSAGDQVDTCSPGTPNPETCNSVDDDCDGSTDEDLTQPTLNQFGLCAGNTETCTGGVYIPDLTNYEPSEEICNGLDDNCDNSTDEDLSAPLADMQLGVCAGSLKVCTGTDGWAEPDYTEMPGYEETEVTCDAKDNDCDGWRDTGVCNWYCLETAEQAPTETLGVNRHIWKGGAAFTTLVSKTVKGKTNFYNTTSQFTLDQTNGCSCSQILEILQDYSEQFDPTLFGEMNGHWKFGCSKSVMEEFVRMAVPEVKVLIDTVAVPSDQTTASSVATISPAKEYLLKASGTYKFANWAGDPRADAKCSYRGTADPLGLSGWVSGDNLPAPYQNYLEVKVNGNVVDWGVASGTCNADNNYNMEITGVDHLSFNIYDGGAIGDNSGSIQVDIFELLSW